MNALERELHYPFGDRLPTAGEALEVAPGIRWIRMGLPFALDHINLWLLDDEVGGRRGVTVVDCCIDKPASRERWEMLFAGPLRDQPVLRVVVTHMHPDHVGLAHWLCERFDAPLWMSATDYNAARNASRSTTAFGGEHAAQFFASHGLNDPGSVEQIRARSGYYPGLVPALPASFRRIMDGDRFAIGGRSWRCISGYGHAPEHMALYCEELKVLVSGDMMLPRISTNVSVYDVEPESNPLALFLDSIDKFRALPEGTLTLPSHGKPFLGLHPRIRQLHDHHRERLDEVLEACGEKACSGMDAVAVMFKRPLDLHQTTFALGEAVAHLHALWFEGKLQRHRDAEGVWRFTKSAAPLP